MMKNKNTLIIAEWQKFGTEDIKKGGIGSAHQAQKIFNELVDFAHQEGNRCFLKFKNSNTLVAQNYVGLIQTKSGFCVEILPKTFQATNESQGFEAQKDENKKQELIESAKNLLLRMLQALKNSPFKYNQLASLKVQNMPLLEIFVLMFLNELDNLVKKGLKSNYTTQEENRKFLKGKLLFNQNLKYNLTHKERFFTASDEFSVNIAPNRIIKSTLELLSRQSFSSKIYTRLTQMRFIFADIASSRNIDKDLSQCAKSRLFNTYDLILQWCKVFLRKQAFTPYQGSAKAFALLFDMNKLFESFVANEMKKWFINENFRINNTYYKDFMESFEKKPDLIKTQEKRKFLALEEGKEGEDRFCLKPDIVGYEKAYKDLKPVFIADTKWKILNDDSKNYGISQNDMYQMFAYLTKYECEQGFLIYPEIANNNKSKTFIFKYNSEIKLKTCFFPL